jgi:RNA-binding protein
MSQVITAAQKRYLRGLAHPLKPVILVGGKGITDAVIAELDIALERHELLKARIAAEDRETRDAWISDLAERSGAALVQRVGHIVTLYRASREKPPQIVMPRG